MSDETDLATDREEKEREKFIERARRPEAMKSLVRPVFCMNGCGDKPREKSNYCSGECLEDHERRNKLAARRGAA